MSNVSIIVQGRLHSNSLSHLQEYRKWGPVILSHREDDDLARLKSVNMEGIVRVTHSPVIPDTTLNMCSGYYHALSVLTGLRKVTTEFAIKIRSDVFVGNLQPMIDKMAANPDKYVCSQMYFRPDHVSKLHPSDQIVGMKTSVFIATMEIACYRLANHSHELLQCFCDHRQDTNSNYTYYRGMPGSKQSYSDYTLPRGTGLTPEVLFGTSYLAAKDIIQVPAESRRIMKENFEVVRLEDMFPYIDGRGNINMVPYGGLPVIRSMEEL